VNIFFHIIAGEAISVKRNISFHILSCCTVIKKRKRKKRDVLLPGHLLTTIHIFAKHYYILTETPIRIMYFDKKKTRGKGEKSKYVMPLHMS